MLKKRAGPHNSTRTLKGVIDEETALKLSELFKALADPTRVRILSALRNGEACVHEITAAVGMSQSAISHQLRYLRNLRLIKHRRQGRHVYYQLDDAHIRDLFNRGLDHVKHG